MLEPRVGNLIIVLATTRTPIYLRVTRAEVLEIRERVFVDASRAFGSSRFHILRNHIAPIVAPTLLTIMTVDFASVMLSESGLSFLGIGIQPPAITWGLMVAQGRNYLARAWWLAFFPGLRLCLRRCRQTFCRAGCGLPRIRSSAGVESHEKKKRT